MDMDHDEQLHIADEVGAWTQKFPVFTDEDMMALATMMAEKGLGRDKVTPSGVMAVVGDGAGGGGASGGSEAFDWAVGKPTVLALLMLSFSEICDMESAALIEYLLPHGSHCVWSC